MFEPENPPQAYWQSLMSNVLTLRGFSLISVGLAWILAIASLIMCATWTQGNGVEWLGTPSWEKNVFAWHPLLMVCGFFFSQVLAITAWEIFADKIFPLGVSFHAFWQFGAAATLAAGLTAIFTTHNRVNRPNLTTMHSWIGIATTILFYGNFVIAITSAPIPKTSEAYHVFPSYTLKIIHSLIGMSAFFFTVVAIISGIAEKQGGTCTYDGWRFTSPDYDPASNWNLIPLGCRISNIMGFLVAITTLLVLYAAISRHLMKANDREPAAQGKGEEVSSEKGDNADKEEVERTEEGTAE